MIDHFDIKTTCCIIDSIFMNIARLIFSIFTFRSSKRTVDFGLGRGLSGAIEAKHRLGMAAANFAGLFFSSFPSRLSILSMNSFHKNLSHCLYRWTRTSATIWKCRLNSSIQLQTLYKATPNRHHELHKDLKKIRKGAKLKKAKYYHTKSSIDFQAKTFDFSRSKFSIFT